MNAYRREEENTIKAFNCREPTIHVGKLVTSESSHVRSNIVRRLELVRNVDNKNN